MACNECGGNHEGELKLDGSLGTGDTALLTLITKDDVEGQREETFEFPYALIDFSMLQKFSTFKLILGYKVIRVPALQKEGTI
jgi:hypothetical protein